MLLFKNRIKKDNILLSAFVCLSFIASIFFVKINSSTTWQTNPYIKLYEILIPITLAFSLTSFYIIIKNIRNISFIFFFLFVLCSLGIFFGHAAEFYCKAQRGCLIAGNITYTFISFLGVFWLLFVFKWTTGFTSIRPVVPILLFIIPCLTIFFKCTDNNFHFIWIKNHFIKVDGHLINVVDDYGFWFYIHTFYSYGTYIVGCFILLLESHLLWKNYQIRAALLILGSAIPIVMNVPYVFRDTSKFYFDFSTGAFSISSFFYSLVMVHFNLFTLPQPSPRQLANSIEFGIITITKDGLILDNNKYSLNQFNQKTLSQKNIFEILEFKNPQEIKEKLLSAEKWSGICRCNNNVFNLSIVPQKINDKKSIHVFTIVSIYNQAKDEKEDSVAENSLYDSIYKSAVSAQLSSRELDILKEILTTKSKKEIAHQLNISPETVHTHTTHIFKKLNCASRSELREFAKQKFEENE